MNKARRLEIASGWLAFIVGGGWGLWFLLALWGFTASSDPGSSFGFSLSVLPSLSLGFLIFVAPTLGVAIGATLDARAHTKHDGEPWLVLLVLCAFAVAALWGIQAILLVTQPYDRLQDAPILIAPTIATAATIAACAIGFTQRHKRQVATGVV